MNAILQFMETGGGILWVILLVTVLMWALILERYWFFKLIYPQRVKAWVEEWRGRPERASWYAHRIREAVISQANVQLGRTVPVVRMLIAVCPLLGLLGTVTGMIEVFDVMALKGTSDARAMAGGVYRATIPTMAGMVVALSGLYFGTRLRQIQRIETERLADALRYS